MLLGDARRGSLPQNTRMPLCTARVLEVLRTSLQALTDRAAKMCMSFLCSPLHSPTALGCLWALGFLIALAPLVALAQPEVSWRVDQHSAIAYGTAFRYPKALFRAKLHLIRFPRDGIQFRVVRAKEFGVPRATLETFVIKSHAIAGINANFFDERGEALGLVVSGGKILQPLHRGGSLLTTLFGVTRNGPLIQQRDEFSARGIFEAAQGGPRLIEKGKVAISPRDGLNSSRRAGACISEAGAVIFFCSEEGLLGFTLAELKEILSSAEVGCFDAINFDGGGSAQLFVSAAAPQSLEPLIIHGKDEVPVALLASSAP